MINCIIGSVFYIMCILINKKEQTMLKIKDGYEKLIRNEKVAIVTLEDNTVWHLTDYMYVDWDEFTETTHEELIECGWRHFLTIRRK